MIVLGLPHPSFTTDTVNKGFTINEDGFYMISYQLLYTNTTLGNDGGPAFYRAWLQWPGSNGFGTQSMAFDEKAGSFLCQKEV